MLDGGQVRAYLRDDGLRWSTQTFFRYPFRSSPTASHLGLPSCCGSPPTFEIVPLVKAPRLPGGGSRCFLQPGSFVLGGPRLCGEDDSWVQQEYECLGSPPPT